LAQKAVQKAKQQSQDASVEELIKNALQSLWRSCSAKPSIGFPSYSP
jgi:hypothetical protein